jgi:hypothetical protein
LLVMEGRTGTSQCHRIRRDRVLSTLQHSMLTTSLYCAMCHV